jgi:acetyltransferase-like isoleucine patch superfamily enzyme
VAPFGRGARRDGRSRSVIHPTARLNDGAIVVGDVEIEEDVSIGSYTVILAEIGIRIGAHTQIAAGCNIVDHDHDMADLTLNRGVMAPIDIGPGCWIAGNVSILKGVTLGEGCVVGAGSVVTRSFTARSVLFGVPARFVRTRV